MRLDAIVNNAGVMVSGPMEAVAPDEWRKQLEINVIGQLAVTQAVLPRLRKSRGRVVFISSVNGRLSMSLIGAYCASKFALEAAADALRMELRPWHIGVAIVEPAQTDTDMWHTADDMVEQAEAALTAEQRDLYARHIAGMKKMIPVSQKLAVPAEKVSAVVEEALTARRPRARYVVGIGPKLQVALMTNLPVSVRDRVLRRDIRPALSVRQAQCQGAHGFFACEAAGLQWLSAADGGVPCARVIAYDDTSLTLERLDSAAPTRAAAHEFGRRLARTHDAGADAFGAPPHGWTGPGYFGPLQQPLPMSYSAGDRWGSFYANERLAPMADRAATRLDAQARDAVDAVMERCVAGDFDDDDGPRGCTAICGAAT